MIPFDIAVNSEEILDFAFYHICSSESWDVHPIAERIVTWYIMNEFAAAGKNIEDEVAIKERYDELMADHIMTKLAADGLVDVEINETGDIVYSVTQAGRNKVNERTMS